MRAERVVPAKDWLQGLSLPPIVETRMNYERKAKLEIDRINKRRHWSRKRWRKKHPHSRDAEFTCKRIKHFMNKFTTLVDTPNQQQERIHKWQIINGLAHIILYKLSNHHKRGTSKPYQELVEQCYRSLVTFSKDDSRPTEPMQLPGLVVLLTRRWPSDMSTTTARIFLSESRDGPTL